jgi:small subunit ribosomal protein S16
MLAIRLARVGKKNKAQYKIVLQEHTVAPGGRHVEILGSYDPHQKKAIINGERVKYWIGKGAQASDTVYNLFVSQNIISGKKRLVKISKKAAEAPTPAEAAVNKPVEAKVEEAKPAEVKTEMPTEEKKTEEPKEEPKKE